MNNVKDIKEHLQLLEDEWCELSYAFHKRACTFKRANVMKTLSQTERDSYLLKQEDNLRRRLELFDKKADLLAELSDIESK